MTTIPAFSSSQLRQLPSVMVNLITNGQSSLVNLRSCFEKTEQLKVLVYSKQQNSVNAFIEFYKDFKQITEISRNAMSSQTENFEHVVIVPITTPELEALMARYKPVQGFSVVVDHNAVTPHLPAPNKGSVLRYASGYLVEDKLD